ncbi:WD domain-containing protein [Fusarium pseudocircinatum]|uniref:WD domain-containing protein n=1 Tax=Fusarium pseudocircinatum TaxID=56676 RepID=A0A8H5PUL1_9HYPO|nr:WD domain-containing protein [Fusarium pseudocircinatum]
MPSSIPDSERQFVVQITGAEVAMTDVFSIYRHANELAYSRLPPSTFGDLPPSHDLDEDAIKRENAQEFLRFELAILEISGAQERLEAHAATKEYLIRDEDEEQPLQEEDPVWTEIQDGVKDQVIKVGSKIQDTDICRSDDRTDINENDSIERVAQHTESVANTGIVNKGFISALLPFPPSTWGWMDYVNGKAALNNTIAGWISRYSAPAYDREKDCTEGSKQVELLEALYRLLASHQCQENDHEVLLQLSDWAEFQEKETAYQMFLFSCRAQCWQRTVCHFKRRETGTVLDLCEALHRAWCLNDVMHVNFNHDMLWQNVRNSDLLSKFDLEVHRVDLESLLTSEKLSTNDLNANIRKFRLALRIGSSLHLLLFSSWMQQDLDSCSVQIIPDREGDITHMLDKAFISCRITSNRNESNIQTAPDLQLHSKEYFPKCILSFAQLLVDIANGVKSQPPETVKDWHSRLSEELRNRSGDLLMSEYWNAVRGCLLFRRLYDNYLSCLPTTEKREMIRAAQHVIFKNIVSPLRKHLSNWEQEKKGQSLAGTKSEIENLELHESEQKVVVDRLKNLPTAKRQKTEGFEARKNVEYKFILWLQQDDQFTEIQKSIHDPDPNGYISRMKIFQETYISTLPKPCPVGGIDGPVRVAVVDTGFYLEESSLFTEGDEFLSDPVVGSRVKEQRNFFSRDGEELNEEDTKDIHGHGTLVARLVLQFAPRAEVIVARITDSKTLRMTRTAQLVEALKWAGDNADIINLSFSLGKMPDPELAQVIQDLVDCRQKLIFAAASNEGPLGTRMWPAKAPGVFAIHATNDLGHLDTALNPGKESDRDNFAVFGSQIESYWAAWFPALLTYNLLTLNPTGRSLSEVTTHYPEATIYTPTKMMASQSRYETEAGSGSSDSRLQDIYSRALECKILFHQYSTISTPYSKEISKYQQRFLTWTSFLGVFTSESASLDRRLEFNPEVKEPVVAMLQVLQRNLERFDRLYRLAVVIRHSPRTDEVERVRKFASKQEPNGFANLVSAIVRFYFPDAEQSLLAQLAESIVYRRDRMLWSRRHSKKLSQERNEEKEAKSAKTETSTTAQTPPGIGVTASSSQRQLHTESQVKTVYSGTIPSKRPIRVHQIKKESKKDDASSARSANPPPRAHYPELPPVPSGKSQTSCPYCLNSIEISGNRRKARKDWIAHLNADLRPYVCVSEACKNFPIAFATAKEWEAHMENTHGAEWARDIHRVRWYCESCGDKARPFSSEDVFAYHLKDTSIQGHKKSMDEFDFERIKSSYKQIYRREPNSCPLCNWPNDDKTSVPAEERTISSLPKHFARHLQQLSLLSISWWKQDIGEADDDILGSVHGTASPIGQNSEIDVNEKTESNNVFYLDSNALAELEKARQSAELRGQESYSALQIQQQHPELITGDPVEPPDALPGGVTLSDLETFGISTKPNDDFVLNHMIEIRTSIQDNLPSLELLEVPDYDNTDVCDKIRKAIPQTDSVVPANSLDDILTMPLTRAFFGHLVNSVGSVSDEDKEQLIRYCTDEVLSPRVYYFADAKQEELASRKRLSDEPMATSNIYSVGWICASRIELVAAQALLDAEETRSIDIPEGDNNYYTFGMIGKHHVVIGTMPLGQYGLSNATTLATNMVRTFLNIKFILSVGVGGGVPTRHDIRRGDVVVAYPSSDYGGVIQCDYGKSIQGQGLYLNSSLDRPPAIILSAISSLQAEQQLEGLGLEQTLQTALASNPRLMHKCQRPPPETDRLYRSEFIHPPGATSCSVGCPESNFILRRPRSEDEDNPAIHYGLIASGNKVMKDAIARDRLSAQHDVLCFDMEAAGLMDHVPCGVIRGICDYSDSHGDRQWQGYAAMMAAAYAKELLLQIPPVEEK